MKKQSCCSWFLLGVALQILLCCQSHAAKNFSKQDLPGRNFANDNLKGALFDGANVAFANFTNATLKGASFLNADLRGASFRQADLEGADFTGAILIGAAFTDANAKNAKLPGTILCLARASPSDLNALGEKLPRPYRIETAGPDRDCGSLSFQYADLQKSRILGNAEKVDFRGADLRGADLRGVENLDKAWLKGAKYDGNTRWKVDPAQVEAVPVRGARD